MSAETTTKCNILFCRHPCGEHSCVQSPTLCGFTLPDGEYRSNISVLRRRSTFPDHLEVRHESFWLSVLWDITILCFSCHVSNFINLNFIISNYISTLGGN